MVTSVLSDVTVCYSGKEPATSGYHLVNNNECLKIHFYYD